MHVLFIRLYLAVTNRLRGETGQTSAEYALVLLGAATVALLVVSWAGESGAVGDLLDTMFDKITKLV